MTVSTVDANTGIYESYTEVGTSIEDIPHAVVGSSSIPLIFPPHDHFPGKLHIDGGTAYGVDSTGDAISNYMRYRQIKADHK